MKGLTGQQKAAARKRQRQREHQEELVDEAERLGMSVEDLRRMKQAEVDAIKARPQSSAKTAPVPVPTSERRETARGRITWEGYSKR